MIAKLKWATEAISRLVMSFSLDGELTEPEIKEAKQCLLLTVRMLDDELKRIETARQAMGGQV
jgi:hypothetical protein